MAAANAPTPGKIRQFAFRMSSGVCTYNYQKQTFIKYADYSLLRLNQSKKNKEQKKGAFLHIASMEEVEKDQKETVRIS